MKRLLTAALLFWCAAAYGTGPEYRSSCSWVGERCPINQVPAQERVFVATTPGSEGPNEAAVLRYRKGLSIREIIDQTRFRGTNAAVTVLRSKKPGTPVFNAVVSADDRPGFKLKPRDMVWVGDPRLPQ